MNPGTEHIAYGKAYFPVPPGEGTHVYRDDRIIRKHYWLDFFVNVLALGAIIFGTMIVLGIACTLVGAG
jgi:hypothetical protein